MAAQTTTRNIASLLGATLAPILVVSSYLYYSRTHSKDFSGDYAAIAVAALVGAIGIQFLGAKSWLVSRQALDQRRKAVDVYLRGRRVPIHLYVELCLRRIWGMLIVERIGQRPFLSCFRSAK
jgi:hypothetical protein